MLANFSMHFSNQIKYIDVLYSEQVCVCVCVCFHVLTEAQAYNPFDEYVLQNLGVRECFINKCAAHSHSCAGELQFIGENNPVHPRPFMGTLFSVHKMQCRLCGVVLLMDCDLFEQRPNP